MLLALFILALQMHTDMGDERGIRLRCISLGRAVLRGSRMRGMAICSKGSESRIARSSLSIARSSVCAVLRCLRINITIRQKYNQMCGTLPARVLYAEAERMLVAYSDSEGEDEPSV